MMKSYWVGAMAAMLAALGGRLFGLGFDATPASLDLALPPVDEGVQLGRDRRLERRCLELGQEGLPDPVGSLGGGPRAVLVPGLEVAPVRDEWPVEGGLVALERVGSCRRSGRPGPTSTIASKPSSASSTAKGTRTSAIICRISASMISFSNEAVRPPSSQPAPWYSRLTPPITAPHTAISDS